MLNSILRTNVLNSSLVKDEPLSVTITRGSPCVANTDLRVSIVLADVIDDMM